MVHNTADKVAEARLAAITHEQLKEKIVPSYYVKKHGMDYDLIDYRVGQLIEMFGEPTDYSPTRTDPKTGRRFAGYAIWRYPSSKKDHVPNMPFLKKIFVKDHLLLHGNHIDFLFTKTDIAWTDTRTMKKANKISESIMINKRYETCTTGCHMLSANLISHYVAWRVAMGLINEWEARKMCKTLMKAAAKEVEKADELGEELMMPLHSTIIDYLNTMFNGYAKESEVAEEVVVQGLEALDEATGGKFLYKTPEELAETIDRNRGSGTTRSTSVGTVSVTTEPSMSAGERLGFLSSDDDEDELEEFAQPRRSGVTTFYV